jgi:hypothetical protein
MTPKKKQIKTTQNHKLDRESFNAIFSSDEKVNDYAASILNSVKETLSSTVTQAKDTLKSARIFPKIKAPCTFDITQIFPPMNVKKEALKKPKTVLKKSEKKVKVTLDPLPKKEKEVTPPPIKKDPLILKKKKAPIIKDKIQPPKAAPVKDRIPTLKKKRVITKSNIKQTVVETTSKANPVATVTNDLVEKRLKERQNKIQTLFNKKGNVS